MSIVHWKYALPLLVFNFVVYPLNHEIGFPLEMDVLLRVSAFKIALPVTVTWGGLCPVVVVFILLIWNSRDDALLVQEIHSPILFFIIISWVILAIMPHRLFLLAPTPTPQLPLHCNPVISGVACVQTITKLWLVNQSLISSACRLSPGWQHT